MDEYKISQTPDEAPQPEGQAKPNSVKPKKAPKASHRPASGHRQTRSLDPQLVLGGIVGVLVLSLVSLVWIRFVNKPAANTTPAKSTSNSATTKPIPVATFNGVTAAIDGHKAADLGHYYAAQVHIVIPGKGVNQTLGANQAAALINSLLNGAQNPWNWHLPAGQIATWQQGPDGQYFQGNVIIGESGDGTVVSIGVDGSGNITSVFITNSDDLAGDGSGGGSTSGGSGGDSTSGSGSSSSDGSGGSTTPPTTTNNNGNDSD